MVIKKIKVKQLKRVIRFTKYKTYITEYNLDYSKNKKYDKKKRIVGTVNTYSILNNKNNTINYYSSYNLDNINDWPTSIRYRDTYITFIWHKDGKLHRENGPAVMNIDQYRRQVFSKYYYINGKKIEDELQILVMETK